jgi:hypothetical protein
MGIIFLMASGDSRSLYFEHISRRLYRIWDFYLCFGRLRPKQHGIFARILTESSLFLQKERYRHPSIIFIPVN